MKGMHFLEGPGFPVLWGGRKRYDEFWMVSGSGASLGTPASLTRSGAECERTYD